MIQWVECSRCTKWRIIPARPDGAHEDIPDIWFCEMNTDIQRNHCDDPEEEYKAPTADLPARRLPKSNDPDSIRAVLKNLSGEELQAAYESLDMGRIFREEFGSNLESAKSRFVVRQKPRVAVGKSGKKPFDVEGVRREIHSLVEEARKILPQNIQNQFTCRK